MDTNTSRRRFLGTAAGLTGAALATGAWRQSPEGATGNAAGGGGRTFSAGGAELQLGTTNMGALRSVEGGWVHLGAPSTGGGICPTNPCILPAGV